VNDEPLSLFRTNPWRPLVAEECAAVRERVGVLDLPGFTKIDVEGPGAEAYLDHLLCTKLPKVGRVTLAYALLADGKVLSELPVTRLAADRFYLCGAASAEWHDLDVLEAALPTDGSVTLRNVTHDRGSLIVMGPRSRDVLAAVTTSSLDNAAFPWLSVRDIDTAVGPVRALRVNYVGELGWELHATTEQLPALYAAIWAAGEAHGIRDVGIYAVDSLRLDKCYRGWKGDLEIGFSPFDASLDRFVDLTKPDFVGKAALVAEHAAGSPWRFVPLTLDEAGEADAPFCSSVFQGDRRVGIVTSGGWSFTLGVSVALAYLEPSCADAGTVLEIEVYGTRVTATVGVEPLYDPTNARLRS
jgi:dimethylglycine dehydrogenase